jgi:TPR repeat protein
MLALKQFQKVLICGVTLMLFFGCLGLQDISYSESATITKIKELASKGDTLAQIMLGEIYFDYLGVPQDSQKAYYWFKRAAEKGDFPNSSLTEYYYSWVTSIVEGAQTEKLSAREKKAAEQGDPAEQYYLGDRYWRGYGVPQDYKESFFWYKKAAEQGVPGAQSKVGLMYYQGKGVTSNYQLASEWFKKAAEQGDKLAQLALGTMYYKGQGISIDYQQALHWVGKAAAGEEIPYKIELDAYSLEELSDKGDKLAQASLGLAYYYAGKQAQQEDWREYHKKLALSLFIKSAQQGFTPAYVEIGELYERGKSPNNPQFLTDIPQDSNGRLRMQ